MRITYLLFAASAVFLTSVSSKPKPSAKAALKVLKGFCEFVPSGNAVVDGDTVSVQAFYMSTNEITNIQYLEFLTYLKNHDRLEELEKARVDTIKWNTTFSKAYMNPMALHYDDHPAYRNYPVVNISKEGAVLYCKWLTEV
ncbi:MAG: SUMF1/EgtB/PvdO family nonheme iron enzyme, partial [Crocinitomicaceae bacterium]